MIRLGLHHLTACETGPAEFITLASAAGCREVSLFVQPLAAGAGFPLVTAGNRRAVADTLAATGLRLANAECFMLTPTAQVAAFEPALELGAELGARGATALLYDDDTARTEDRLAALCELAAAMELRISVEFMPLAPRWKTMPEAAALVAAVGQPNLALGIDLLHLVRSGGTPDQVAELPPGLVGHAQLCDGASLTVTEDYAEEASADRVTPGRGVFPLREFVRALPSGTPLELEVPQPPERPAAARIEEIVSAAQALLEDAPE